jgi:hypothetical protein
VHGYYCQYHKRYITNSILQTRQLFGSYELCNGSGHLWPASLARRQLLRCVIGIKGVFCCMAGGRHGPLCRVTRRSDLSRVVGSPLAASSHQPLIPLRRDSPSIQGLAYLDAAPYGFMRTGFSVLVAPLALPLAHLGDASIPYTGLVTDRASSHGRRPGCENRRIESPYPQSAESGSDHVSPRHNGKERTPADGYFDM